ncbi:hypothetical protein GCM10023149_22340 [Mucilaginibacter gynuensis]|uniref:Uncharacterized protein n=1 Tax=Mucilaginibacter gynuensis TaxID=1302236 RepID=A0ABP8GD76_9SPHI
MLHTFHIPVLGLAYSIDTPLKVARYGISSVVSIVDDELVERMRQYHSLQNNEPYTPIIKNEPDHRARRITAYLNLLHKLVNAQFEVIRHEAFTPGSDICRYFELLPPASAVKKLYNRMLQIQDDIVRTSLQNVLRGRMRAGAIDVNIMAKVDKMNYNAAGEPDGEQNTDALAALRGFAMSDLSSAVTLSAGMNPRLYSYLESFNEFFPDEAARLHKRVILKVSDFRSALIQAKFLAKKGVWVSEFRIESGLNCGGHAFATDGLLLGPILEDFKQKRQEMQAELWAMCSTALKNKGYHLPDVPLLQRVSVQGGIGTAGENDFLLNYYRLDATGWGSPFLLVPEATNVDDDTLQSIAKASNEDYYVSDASPLGILFNNFRGSTAEVQRLERIAHNRPGSPCTKKFLVTNTEFTEQPICTASREYQHLKLKQLQAANLTNEAYQEQFDQVTAKICLCEGLCTSAYIKNDMLRPRENRAVAICPGPNLAYFSKVYSLDEMVKHIYGKLDLLEGISRPNMFINELNLYIDHLKKDIGQQLKNFTDKKEKYLVKFKDQLLQGIIYYKQLIPQISGQTEDKLKEMQHMLLGCEAKLNALI